VKTRFWKSGIAGVFALLAATAAQAIPVSVAFTATGFVPLFGSTPAPDDPVSGTIVYDAASVNAAINSLTSITLTINGHVYTLGEIGFLSDPGIGEVGGLIDGVNGSGSFEDDFVIIWDMNALTPLLFLYATANSDAIWTTSSFSSFSVTAAPEPATLALFALGVLGAGVAQRFRS